MNIINLIGKNYQFGRAAQGGWRANGYSIGATIKFPPQGIT